MKKIFCFIALTLCALFALSACGAKPVVLPDDGLEKQKIIDFATGADKSVVFESDGWANGGSFNVVWKESNVVYEDGLLKLGIKEEKASVWDDDQRVTYDYTAGEVRTHNYYHYGDFEVSMKPSKNPGTASTFFTCTGPYDKVFLTDEEGEFVLDDEGQRVVRPNPHDEIDIEFLGKDTTKVQFNFFVDGKGGNEYMHDLGFDAAEDFHTYGYRWAEDSITWFVDGEPVYKVTTDKAQEKAKNLRIVDKLPSTPGRILANYWCGNKQAVGWMGKYSGAVKDNGAEYQWFSSTAVARPLNPVEDGDQKPDEVEGIDWAKISPVAPTFGSTSDYYVQTNGNEANVTYNGVGGSTYVNVEMDISACGQGKNYLYMEATNNGTADVSLRVNLVDMELVSQGAQNMSTNLSATMDGSPVFTDAVWGGSFFEIGGGKTAVLVVEYSGQVERLQLMIDSSRNNANTYAGDVTVKNIKFATFGNGGQSPDDGPIDGPVDGLEAMGLAFSCEAGTGYTLDNNNGAAKVVNVRYSGLGNTWKPITANAASLAAGNNTFTVTVKNNGTADARVRFDIQGTTWVATGDGSGTDACNQSASGGDVWTDLTWGGSTLTVPAGGQVVVTITFDGEGVHGAVKNLLVFVDSARGDGGTYNADITLSDMSFYKA